MLVRKCCIVEDDEAAVEDLKNNLSRLPFFQIVGVCKNYEEAISLLHTQTVDLLFLDIELGTTQDDDTLTGLDILRTLPNPPAVIVISNHDKYAVESFDINTIVDYLTKPIEYKRFLRAINRALDTNLQPHHLLDKSYMFLKMGRKFQRFNFDEIDYFETYGIYMKVYANGQSFVVNDSISALLERLDGSKFMRVHKSYIVNIQKINGFDANSLILHTGNHIPIGVSYKGKLEGLLRLFDKLED
jgi:DNA-binding LytR/AlgR family response regulator